MVTGASNQTATAANFADRDIRVGVVGYGLAGRVFHCPFIAAVPGLQLSGIVQRTGDSAALAWPSATIHRSLDDLLASDVDLVVVATPNSDHAPMTMAALNAGKHVVVDKPMAGSWQQALAMESLAKKHGLMLAAFHCSRWHGDFLTLQSVLQHNALGRLVTIEAKMDRYKPSLRDSKWKEEESPQNGILMDLGPHMVDQMVALLGRPLSVIADVRRNRSGSKIADSFDLGMDFLHEDTPVSVRLQATLIAASAGPRFVAHGTHGTFEKRGIDQQQGLLEAGGQVPSLDEAEVWWQEEEAFWGELTSADPSVPSQVTKQRIPTISSDYRGYYANIRDVLRGDAELAVTARDGARTVRLLELALQSSEEGRRITVTDDDWN